MTDKEIVERAKEAEKRTGFGELVHSPISKGVNSAYGIGFIEGMVEYRNSLQEEPINENFEEALAQEWKGYNDRGAATVDALEDNTQELAFAKGFYRGTKWQKSHLWKPADGDDLPKYEREVVVFTQNYPDDAGMMTVAIGHRPTPEGYDGKSLTTGKVEHYIPKTYGKGGWNIPNVKYWLDCLMPKEIEL